jgi:hypothetical protein
VVECLLPQVQATSNLLPNLNWAKEMGRTRLIRLLKVSASVDWKCDRICVDRFSV